MTIAILPTNSIEPLPERYEFLAHVSRALAESLEYEAVLAAVAQAAIPALADLCLVDVVEAGGAARRVVAAGDAARSAGGDGLRRGAPAAVHGRTVPGAPLLLGRPIAAWLPALADSPAELAALRALRPTGAIIAPLSARGASLGTLTLLAAAPRRAYGDADLALAEELAARCALALDGAQRLRRLEEAMRARVEQLDAVAHDLKNPLTVIGGIAQLLHRRLARDADLPDAPALARRVAQISTAAAQMQGRIDDLLDLARGEEGPLALVLAPADLAALVLRIVDTHRLAGPRRRLAADVPLRSLTGVWDERRIERALASLLAHAAASHHGDGEIMVRLRRHERGSESWALVEIEGRRARVLSAAEGGRAEQNDVGLAAARVIISQHGGTLVESVAGEDTSILRVELPLR